MAAYVSDLPLETDPASGVSPLQIPGGQGLPLAATSSGGSTPADQLVQREIANMHNRPAWSRLLLGGGDLEAGLAVQKQQLAAQHVQGQTALANAQAAEHGANLIGKFQEIIQSEPDEARREELKAKFAPIVSSVYKRILTPDQQAVLLHPETLDKVLSSSDYSSAVQAAMPWVDSRGWAYIRQGKTHADREDRTMQIVDGQVQPLMLEIGAAVKTLPPKADGSHYTFTEAQNALKSQMDVKHALALNWWLHKTDPKKIDNQLLNMGIEPLSAEAKQQAAAGQQKQRSDLLKVVQTEMLADPQFAAYAKSRGMDSERAISALPLTDLQPFIQAARAQQLKAQVDVAAATGVGVENAKRTLPMEQKDRSQHVLIDQLMQGRLVQPPAGVTREAVASNPNIAYIDDKQKERFAGLQPTQNVLNTLGRMSEQLVTATTPGQALNQGIQLGIAAKTKSNPIATTYGATVDTFLSNLSRTLSAEKGTLNEGDVKRISNAMTTFYDTKTVRLLKTTILQEMYDTAQQTLIGEISGKPVEARGKLSALVDRIVAANDKSILDHIKPGQQAIRQGSEIMFGKQGSPVPKGWELVK